MMRFLFISMGSLAELETLLLLAQNIGYSVDFENINKKLIRERALITGLQRSIRQKMTDKK